MEQKKKYRMIFLGIAGCILLYWALNQTSQLLGYVKAILNILSPFIIGASLAFILNVPMRAFERWLQGIGNLKVRRALALLLTFLSVLVVITGVILLLIPQINKTVESLKASLPDFFERVKESVTNLMEKYPPVKEWIYKNVSITETDWSGLLQKVMGMLNINVAHILQGATTAVVGIGNGIFNAVLSVVFCVYAMIQKEKLARQCRKLVYALIPEKTGDEIIRILRMTSSTFSNFISGQCLEALILGVMFAITMPIFNMPYMPLVSVIIAITALVPIVGAFVGCGIGAIFILVDNPIQAVWFVVLFLVLQQIEGNLIYPRVVGSSVGLPGMWVLVAVAVGGDLMGVAGMLIMIPLASVLYALLREYTDRHLPMRGIDPQKLKDQPPEPKPGLREKARKKRSVKKKKRESNTNDREKNTP